MSKPHYKKVKPRPAPHRDHGFRDHVNQKPKGLPEGVPKMSAHQEDSVGLNVLEGKRVDLDVLNRKDVHALMSMAKEMDVQVTGDASNLLRRLALSKDHLRETLPDRAVVIDLGEVDVLVGEVAQLRDDLIDGETAFLKLLKYGAQPGLFDDGTSPQGTLPDCMSCEYTGEIGRR